MLKILEDKEQIKLIYTRSTSFSEEIASSDSSFIVFNDDKKSSIFLDETTNPKHLDFISETSFSSLELAKEESNKNIYNYKYYILKPFPLAQQNIAVGSNKVQGIDILQHIQNTKYLLIDDTIYEIDITMSSENELFLTQPVKECACNIVKLAFKEEGFFISTWKIVEHLKKEIVKVTSCIDCDTNIDLLTKEIAYILAAKSAEDCKDLKGAKEIINYFSKYKAC